MMQANGVGQQEETRGLANLARRAWTYFRRSFFPPPRRRPLPTAAPVAAAELRQLTRRRLPAHRAGAETKCPGARRADVLVVLAGRRPGELSAAAGRSNGGGGPGAAFARRLAAPGGARGSAGAALPPAGGREVSGDPRA